VTGMSDAKVRARSAKRERMRQRLENERRRGKRWLARPETQKLLGELRAAGGHAQARELIDTALLKGRRRV
jgi:hypothetical protein